VNNFLQGPSNQIATIENTPQPLVFSSTQGSESAPDVAGKTLSLVWRALVARKFLIAAIGYVMIVSLIVVGYETAFTRSCYTVGSAPTVCFVTKDSLVPPPQVLDAIIAWTANYLLFFGLGYLSYKIIQSFLPRRRCD